MTERLPCSICGKNREVDPDAWTRRLQWCTPCATKVRKGTEADREMDARYQRAFMRALVQARPGTWLVGQYGQLIYYPRDEGGDR